MQKITLNQLVYLLREGSGLTQGALAQAAGVEQSSIARFEREKLNLSPDILLKIADVLGISHDYVLNKSDYPFLAGGFYKLFTAGKSVNKLDFLLALPGLVGSVTVVSIIPALSAFFRFFKVRTPRDFVYAVLIRDDYDTIFILRDKNPSSFIKASEHLIELKPIITPELITVNVFVEYVGEKMGPYSELLELIQSWTVEREDVDYLVATNDPTLMSLNPDEKQLIAHIRKLEISAEDVIKKIPAR